MSAAEADDSAIQALWGPEFMGADHDLGQREAKPIRGAGQPCFGLAGDDVADFPHTIADQVRIH